MTLVGNPPDARDTDVLRRVLDDVAHAIAIIAPIHIYDRGGIETIDERSLITGRFVRGASALIDLDGRERKNLVIQRRDLDSAIVILQQTQLAQTLRAVYRKA